MSSANIVRESCQILTTPIAVNVSSITFAPENQDVFLMDDQIFDLEQANQQITTAWCNGVSATDQVVALVWTIANSTSYEGSIAFTNNTTGTSNVVDLPLMSPTSGDYYTQNPTLGTLSINTNPYAAVNYYPGSGAVPPPITNVQCYTQPLP
jgi:hypothetical protein